MSRNLTASPTKLKQSELQIVVNLWEKAASEEETFLA